jgi:hypothetical protein
VNMLRSLLRALLALAALIALVALCDRVSGGPNAWKVGVLLVASLPLAGFAFRERR